MAATSAIHASKKALRKAMYAKLRAVSEAEIKQQCMYSVYTYVLLY